MELPRSVARFNLVVTNRIQGRWAWALPPWAVVVHTGRRSGRTYRTPVLAWKTKDGIAIALPYGEGAQWVRNLQAAAGGRLIRGRRVYDLLDPSVVDLQSIDTLAPGGRLLGSVSGRVLRARLAPSTATELRARPSSWRTA